jgi:trk system potassium uptake protein TrkA
MLRRLLPRGAAHEFRDASGSVILAEVLVHVGWVGHAVTDLEQASGARVAFLTRLGSGVVPTSSTVYQEGDLVHAVMGVDDVARVERVLGAPPQRGQA